MIPNYPKIMPLPMAQNGNKNEIPLTTETAGLFSYNEGFPPITQVPVRAGGKAPQRNDFNGALNELSQHIFFLQNGGQYQWSAELDYAVGAVILGSNNISYKALQISGPSSGGAKDPTAEENSEYWMKESSISDHNKDEEAHQGAIKAVKEAEKNGQIGTSAVISKQTDLNTVTTQGSYFFGEGTAGENAPPDMPSFFLVVQEAEGNVKQTAHSLLGNDSLVRSYNKNLQTWTEWENLNLDFNILSILGFPSSNFIELPTPANKDEEVNIPADGWLYVTGKGSMTSAGFVVIRNTTKKYAIEYMCGYSINTQGMLPVCKDDKFSLNTSGVTINKVRLFTTIGASNE